MKTVNAFVNINMYFVLMPKYFWKYQNPKVEVMEEAAWERPRYVISRNEKDTMLFWMMEISVPVVLSPSERRKNATRYVKV